ncbi:MAG TPA: NEW3 domain-containing protein [Pseudonocardiaceae bacterium]|nr:NEW3 domain-containing protein [Pseudonocardiaceae bacterium]
MARTSRRQRSSGALGAALAALCCLIIPAPAAATAEQPTAADPAYPSVGPGTHFLDDNALIAGFDEPDWYQANIPFLEVPDQQIQQTYYYRWRTWKEHIRSTGPANGDIVSEFFGAPGYSAPFGGIDAAAGHHIDEGRWLRDQSYVDSDIDYWLQGAGSGPKPQTEGLNPNTSDWAHEYSFWAASSVLADAEVTGDWSQATGLESALVRQYDGWQNQFNPQLGLYWQVPVWDATEYTASSYETDPSDPYHGGAGYRPTINAYQFGDANAIAAIATMTGDRSTAAQFTQRAAALETSMQKYLWDSNRQFFYHMARDDNSAHALVSTREEMGFTPWMFDMPQPSDSVAWQQLTDPQGFAAPYGPTTAERRSSWYMYQADQGCCRWDGPSWPYETSQTLTALANLLDDYPAQSYVTTADYDTLLREYAQTQYQNGSSYLGQAHDPDQPDWLYGADDYNHSSFNDLVISGLLGLRPQATNTLQLKPLVPATWNYFALENVPYHGHNVTILWDRDGSKYHQGAGLHVYVDGAQVARSTTLRAMTIPLPAGHPAQQPGGTFTNDAVNVYSQGYPRAFASDTWPSDSPWNAVDGQVFYDDIPEDTRWTDYGSPNPTDYLGVDFGTAIPVDEIRLYTYDDTGHGGAVHTPAAFTAQYWTGTTWADIPKQTDNPATPAANALNQITFPAINTSQVRIVFTKDAGAAVGVTELEVGQATSAAATLSLGARNAAAITVLPGQKNSVSTTFTNRTNRPLTGVQVRIPLPSGWSARATTSTTAPVVTPGKTFTTTWQVTPSPDAGPGTQTALYANATFGPPGGPGTVQTRTTVNLAYNPSFYPDAQIDDQFTSNTLSNYQVLQPFPNEAAPQLTAGGGQLSATSTTPFFGMLQGSASPASAESTVSVDAAQFTNDPSESEDTLFVGLAKGSNDYVMAWYNNHAKTSGFDVRVNGQLNVGVDTHCCSDVTIVPGDRFAVAYSGTMVTSFLEHDGSWQQLTSFDAGPAINLADPAVRAQYSFALGLRGTHGTVAISRFTGASASP